MANSRQFSSTSGSSRSPSARVQILADAPRSQRGGIRGGAWNVSAGSYLSIVVRPHHFPRETAVATSKSRDRMNT